MEIDTDRSNNDDIESDDNNRGFLQLLKNRI